MSLLSWSTPCLGKVSIAWTSISLCPPAALCSFCAHTRELCWPAWLVSLVKHVSALGLVCQAHVLQHRPVYICCTADLDPEAAGFGDGDLLNPAPLDPQLEALLGDTGAAAGAAAAGRRRGVAGDISLQAGEYRWAAQLWQLQWLKSNTVQLKPLAATANHQVKDADQSGVLLMSAAFTCAI